MIFGFNTDIRHEDTVYHVQSEAREGEQLLQTQVFVRGRCIGKRAISYAASAGGENVSANRNPDGSDRKIADSGPADSGKDQQKEKMLRDLHREVLDAIRDGRLDSVLDKREASDALAGIKELDLEWINADSVHSIGTLMMNMRVTEGGAPIQGARLTFRFARLDAIPYYAQVLTDARGMAEMRVQVDANSLPDASVLVQASFGGRTATRKFQIRPAS